MLSFRSTFSIICLFRIIQIWQLSAVCVNNACRFSATCRWSNYDLDSKSGKNANNLWYSLESPFRSSARWLDFFFYNLQVDTSVHKHDKRCCSGGDGWLFGDNEILLLRKQKKDRARAETRCTRAINLKTGPQKHGRKGGGVCEVEGRKVEFWGGMGVLWRRLSQPIWIPSGKAYMLSFCVYVPKVCKQPHTL